MILNFLGSKSIVLQSKMNMNMFHNFVSQTRGMPSMVLLLSCVYGMSFPTFNKYNCILQWHRNQRGSVGARPPNNENVGAGLYNIYIYLLPHDAGLCPPIITFFLQHCTMQH